MVIAGARVDSRSLLRVSHVRKTFWEEQASAYQHIEEQVDGHVRAGWAGEDVIATGRGRNDNRV